MLSSPAISVQTQAQNDDNGETPSSSNFVEQKQWNSHKRQQYRCNYCLRSIKLLAFTYVLPVGRFIRYDKRNSITLNIYQFMSSAQATNAIITAVIMILAWFIRCLGTAAACWILNADTFRCKTTRRDVTCDCRTRVRRSTLKQSLHNPTVVRKRKRMSVWW